MLEHDIPAVNTTERDLHRQIVADASDERTEEVHRMKLRDHQKIIDYKRGKIAEGEYSKLIGVGIPTRGRPADLFRSLASLRDTADDFSRVEVLVQVDYDDAELLACLPLFEQYNARVVVSPRGNGYGDLHRYYAECFQASFAKHLLVWSDNSQILTKSWDSQIAAIQHELYHGTFNRKHGWAFPLVPRKLFELLGNNIGSRPFVDGWIGDICTNWGSGIQFIYLDDIMMEHNTERSILDEREVHRWEVVKLQHERQDWNSPEVHELKLRDFQKIKDYLGKKKCTHVVAD